MDPERTERTLAEILSAIVILVLFGTRSYGETPEKDRREETSVDLTLTSTAFVAGATIPRKYTGEGDDVSPRLAWEGTPPGTKEFALICDDPDAPTPEPWVHWVLYKIPAERTSLPEGNNTGAVEGTTGWGSPGYRGPMPPPGHGVHRYYFKLYALDQLLDLPPGASKEQLLDAMQGHVLAEAELIGTYERK